MTLFESMYEPFVYVNKQQVSDGEGGLVTEWAEGAEFEAVATLDTTMQARIAEKQGVTSVYTVTTRKSVKLDYHDVIKRVKDGRIFRITSEPGDKTSPKVSTLDMAQYNAEKWELTT